MPLKTKKTHHRTPHDKHGHRRSKKFLKVYAPYIPLLLIVGLGLILSISGPYRNSTNRTLGYATEMSPNSLLDSTNQERLAKNEQPLRLNDKLTQAAQAKAEDMATRNYWSHVTPDGEQPWIFIQRAQYEYVQAAENLAYGFASSQAATSGWMNSPSHRANILNGNLREVGFGIVNVANYQNQGPETIVVAMYGQPLSTTDPITTSQTSSSSPALLAQTNIAQQPQKITVAQAITKGSIPWVNFASGLLLGGIAVYLLSKHTLRLRRALQKSERFIISHPLLDVTLIALLVVTVLLSSTAGNIH